jgi:hypothetical protein
VRIAAVPFPSLYRDNENAQDWSVMRAAACGAGIGVAAALFKMLAPTGERIWTPARFLEMAEAALAFALLCAVAALVRNMLVRHFVERA